MGANLSFSRAAEFHNWRLGFSIDIGVEGNSRGFKNGCTEKQKSIFFTNISPFARETEDSIKVCGFIFLSLRRRRQSFHARGKNIRDEVNHRDLNQFHLRSYIPYTFMHILRIQGACGSKKTLDRLYNETQILSTSIKLMLARLYVKRPDNFY